MRRAHARSRSIERAGKSQIACRPPKRMSRTRVVAEGMKRRGQARGPLRRASIFVRPHRLALAILGAIIVLDSSATAATPLVYRSLIDRGVVASRPDVVTEMAVVLALLALADAALTLTQRWVSARFGANILARLRAELFTHLQKMPVAFYAQVPSGLLIARLNNDVQATEGVFSETLPSAFGNCVSVVVTVVALCAISWRIAVGSLLFIPLVMFPATLLARRLTLLVRESCGLNARLNGLLTERLSISGSFLVKLFGPSTRPEHDFHATANRIRDVGIRQAMYTRCFTTMLVLTAALSTAVVYGWGGVLAARHVLLIGSVVALAAYLSRLFGPVSALSSLPASLTVARVSFERVFEVLDLQPSVREALDAVPIPRRVGSIRFENVYFDYRRNYEGLSAHEGRPQAGHVDRDSVLCGVSFTIQPGQYVALVGESGAGKSTIASLLARIVDPDFGTVSINGLDLQRATFESLREVVGYVTQDAFLFNDTVRNNLLLAKFDATEADLLEALAGAQLRAAVERLPSGLDTVVGERGVRLSGGERQRLAIARLLLRTPDVVVLDEATAHLDDCTEATIREALRSTLAGITCLVVAHRLSSIRHADLILVLANGQIVETGRHEDLIEARGVYARMHDPMFARAGDWGRHDHE